MVGHEEGLGGQVLAHQGKCLPHLDYVTLVASFVDIIKQNLLAFQAIEQPTIACVGAKNWLAQQAF